MIAFTLCSNNYLPMARILGESILRHSPETRFVIGLVDVVESSIDYDELGRFEIVPVSEVGIANLDEMALQYSIVELNTAVKPFYFRFLFEKFSGERNLKICYFDPDIAVYSELSHIEQALDSAAVLLTPHVTTPVAPDGKHPGEHSFLNFGIYNLGFCGMRRSATATALIDWWSARLAKYCKIDVANGIFVDQLWMNLAPIFFENVKLDKHPGSNVAYWNLHERQLSFTEGKWQVNGKWPLIFFHFSDLPPSNTDSITKVPTRFTLQDRPDLKPLFAEYRLKLQEFGLKRFQAVPCAYVERRAAWLQRRQIEFYRAHPLRWVVSQLKQIIPKRFRTFLRTA